MSLITFKARDVSFSEEFDGQLAQVKFDADEDIDSIEITQPYFLISFDFEACPIYHNIEWFDGKKFDGGAKIKKHILNQHFFQVYLDNDMRFDIEHTVNKSVYAEIKRVLDHLK